MEPPEKIAVRCEELRKALKEHGLEGTVKFMTPDERTYGRRLIREALETHRLLMIGELVARTS